MTVRVTMEIETEGAVTRVEREYEPTSGRLENAEGDTVRVFEEPMLEHVTASVASAAVAAHRVHVN